jgi:hypothetical protein
MRIDQRDFGGIKPWLDALDDYQPTSPLPRRYPRIGDHGVARLGEFRIDPIGVQRMTLENCSGLTKAVQ